MPLLHRLPAVTIMLIINTLLFPLFTLLYIFNGARADSDNLDHTAGLLPDMPDIEVDSSDPLALDDVDPDIPPEPPPPPDDLSPPDPPLLPVPPDHVPPDDARAPRRFAHLFRRRRITFGTVNAKFLFTQADLRSKSQPPNKAARKRAKRSMDLDPLSMKVELLSDLLSSLRWPDIFVVTETAGAAGTEVLDWLMFTEIHSKYQAVWTNRSVSKFGGAADSSSLVGAGVLLLVHRRLRAQIKSFPLNVPFEDKAKLDGHLRVWRLDPSPKCAYFADALQNSLLVTAAYIPPPGIWHDISGDAIFNAIEQSEKSIQNLRSVQGVDHIVLGHFNAQLNDLPVRLRLSEEPRASLTQPVSIPDKPRGVLVEEADGLVLHRVKCRSASSSDDRGRRLLSIMESVGMCPTSGVLRHCMPTTWKQCIACGILCKCGKARMKNVNDHCFVSADVVVNALLSPDGDSILKLVSRRINWAIKIDHAVTYGHFLAKKAFRSGDNSAGLSSSSSSSSEVENIRRRLPRLHLSDNKFDRAREQREVSALIGSDLRLKSAHAGSTLSVLDATITSVVLEAQRSCCRGSPAPIDDEFSTVPSKTASSNTKQLWVARNASKRKFQSDKSNLDARLAFALANKNVRVAALQARRSKFEKRAQILTSAFASASRLHWRLLQQLSTDPGEPPSPVCQLLEALNDKDGKLISRDKSAICQLLMDHRRSVTSIPSNLGQKTRFGIGADLFALSAINQNFCALELSDHVALGADSVVSRSATEPFSIWNGPAILPLDPDDVPEMQAVKKLLMLSHAAGSFRKSEEKRAASRLLGEDEKLNAAFDISELSHVLKELKDVGPGLDGISPSALGQLDVSAMTPVLNFLNDVWTSCRFPQSWSEIRLVLHYKGKGTDPHCPDNYRGLGIGTIWEKILSLMMMHRLERFLTETKALHGSQGGFLRQRGPPEQVFSLSESVRAALLNNNDKRPVYMAFIDIERAYDSVIHPKLWVRCAELGIGGRFLAILQEMYANKKSTVDINGELIGSTDVQCGVLQGNPLSPLLFNIYLDELLRKIDTFSKSLPVGENGVPLPTFDRSGNPLDALAFLYSLFFADDGVLLSRSQARMQSLLDFLEIELEFIGLLLNARKTKVLIVPPFSFSESDYTNLKQSVLAAGGFHSRGKVVEVVDEFMYLGIMIYWRWDWHRAIEKAISQAQFHLYRLRQSGFHNRGIPLVFQYRLAFAVVISHLDYVAPLVGVEGNVSLLAKCEVVVSDLLRTITGCSPKCNGDSLKAESGTWDLSTRFRMLGLRFFVKTTCSPPDSTHFRALALSRMCFLNGLGGRTVFGPSNRKLFFFRIVESAKFFPSDYSEQSSFASIHSFVTWCIQLRPTLGLSEFQCFDPAYGPDGSWISVDTDTLLNSHLPLLHPTRVICSSNAAFGMDYRLSIKEHSWNFAPLQARLDSPLCLMSGRWSPPLKSACFSTLRRRGNSLRQQLFQSLISNVWASAESNRRDYAPLKNASYMEPYFFAFSPSSARRVLRARTRISWGNEYDLRRTETRAKLIRRRSRAPSPSSSSTSVRSAILPRLVNHFDRACYVCPSDDSWMPETMEHLFLFCPHPRLVQLRVDVRERLTALATEISDFALPGCPPLPNFNDDVILYATLQLCTGVGILSHINPAVGAAVLPPVLRPVTRSTAAHAVVVASMGWRRRHHQLTLPPASMRSAASWVSFLTWSWRSSISSGHPGPAAQFGKRLVDLVCSHNQRVFSVRRKILCDNVAYLSRNRDPAGAALAPPLVAAS